MAAAISVSVVVIADSGPDQFHSGWSDDTRRPSELSIRIKNGYIPLIVHHHEIPARSRVTPELA